MDSYRQKLKSRDPKKYRVWQDKRNERNRRYMRNYINGKKGDRTYIFSKYEQNSKRRGLEFSLTNEQFEKFLDSECYYCGESSLRVGIDRKDNNKGYLPENCVACCWGCNKLKGVYGFWDFIERCRKITNYLELTKHGKRLNRRD